MVSFHLQELASAVSGTAANRIDGTNCSSVCASTQDVVSGAIFVAVRGFSQDGHHFVDQAFAAGAVAAVVEDCEALLGRPGIVVKDSRAALSKLAALFAGNASTQLKVVGITGTNGKTTTHWIVYHALNSIGIGTLRVGTLGTECMGNDSQAGSLTSPDPVSLHRFLADAYAKGAKACVMETSSHALDQLRVEDIDFEVGVFTNLTRDHLDYHKTFEAYFAAKRHLFDLMARRQKIDQRVRSAVVNVDDSYGNELRKQVLPLGLQDWSFGRREDARVRILEVDETAEAMSINVCVRSLAIDLTLKVPFIGQHNAENVVAAFTVCLALGCKAPEIAKALESTPQVPGRLERVGNELPRIFVDYAHTPDALGRALTAVRASTTGKLWVVFGCGGDRDKGKRPLMATAAAHGADYVVVTSDNPRTESPQMIIDDILASGISPKFVDADRRVAILGVIELASDSDTILIAGKGHEDYQIIGTEKIHFSDQEQALDALEMRKNVNS